MNLLRFIKIHIISIMFFLFSYVETKLLLLETDKSTKEKKLSTLLQ